MNLFANSPRLAAGSFLLACIIVLPGCRSAQVKMPSWPWKRDLQTESAPVEAPHSPTIVPLNPGEPLPAPPEPQFETEQSVPTRVPPAPAPLPDELESQDALPEESEELPRLDGLPPSDADDQLPSPENEPSAKRSRSSFEKRVSKRSEVPTGHVPLTDRNDSAQELRVPSPSLSGSLPQIRPDREIRRTRFR